MDCPIKGVLLTPLKKINHPQGDLYHAIKKNAPGYDGFGEAYFSTIHGGDIKSWRNHTKMTINLVVPLGIVKFVIYDNRKESKTFQQFFEITLSKKNYMRLTIYSGLWMAFKGMDENTSMIMNVANQQHNPEEVIRKELNDIPYNWS